MRPLITVAAIISHENRIALTTTTL